MLCIDHALLASTHRGTVAASNRLHHDGAAGALEVECHVAVQGLGQRQHVLEVLQVEGHVRGGVCLQAHYT